MVADEHVQRRCGYVERLRRRYGDHVDCLRRLPHGRHVLGEFTQLLRLKLFFDGRMRCCADKLNYCRRIKRNDCLSLHGVAVDNSVKQLDWCFLFFHSKACANPLLYGWLNDNFRKEFHKIGTSFIAKTKNNTRTATNNLGQRSRMSVVVQTAGKGLDPAASTAVWAVPSPEKEKQVAEGGTSVTPVCGAPDQHHVIVAKNTKWI